MAKQLIVTIALSFLLLFLDLSTAIENNKTKRTVGPQLHSVTGDSRPPLLLYNDNSGQGPSGINGFYAPVTLKPVFDPDIPKQVAHQQVVYEFQQTPTNAVSNVHVNQFYQPIHRQQASDNAQFGTSGEINSNPASSESVALPVQHSSLVRHGQNIAQVQYPQPQHIQTQQYVPGKYLYVNGKIIYQPNQQQPLVLRQQPQQQIPSPLAYLNNYNQNQLSQRLTPPPAVPVAAGMYRRFNPPVQMQKITKPMNVPDAEEQKEEEEEAPEESDAEEEEEEGDEGYEDEEDDERDHKHFGRYSFDEEDDEDHHGRYEEEDEDNERGSSRNVPKKHGKRKKNHYNDGDSYKYSTSSKYDSKAPKKNRKSVKKSPNNKKMHYKAIKYTRELNGKPKIERLQGKQSENIPVVHKQKIFKEKWFVTKSTDDSNNSS